MGMSFRDFKGFTDAEKIIKCKLLMDFTNCAACGVVFARIDDIFLVFQFFLQILCEEDIWHKDQCITGHRFGNVCRIR